jgi:hypothetical protein
MSNFKLNCRRKKNTHTKKEKQNISIEQKTFGTKGGTRNATQ